MKTGIFSIAVLALLQVAIAQPHGRALKHQHHRRQAVVTEVDYVTVEAAEVVVYVDEHGKPVSTTTIYGNVPAPTDAPPAPPSTPNAPASSPSEAPAPASTTPAAAPPPPPAPKPTTLVPSYGPPPPKPSDTPKESAPASSPASTPQSSSPAPAPASSSTPQPSSGPSSPQGPGFNHGISYSPYNADNSCKTKDQVAKDLASISGYQVLRLYGTDCKQVENVLAAIKGKGVQIFAGLFDIGNVAQEAQTLISAVNGDWSVVNTVNVGNELVNNGKASVDQVVGAIGQAKSLLKGAGYNGPVVTVDTMVAMKNNIGLCKASDYCAINCHAFFDGNVAAGDAGKFVLGWVQQIAAAANKPVVVTESGWPSAGDANGKAVPSEQNQQKAIESLKATFSDNLILYSAYNNQWMKDSASTHNAEKFWGIMGNAPSS